MNESNSKSTLFRSTLILSFLFFVISCNTTLSTFKGDPILVISSGNWDWEQSKFCTVYNHHININNNNMIFIWIDAKNGNEANKVNYTIKNIIGPIIYVEMIGEKRKSSDGKLVSWSIIIKSPYEYCWHRSDWGELVCTKRVLKC